MVAGAAALGSAGEVPTVALAAACAGTFSLASLEKKRRNEAHGRRSGIVLAGALIVALTGASGLLIQVHAEDGEIFAPFAAVVVSSLRPAVPDPFVPGHAAHDSLVPAPTASSRHALGHNSTPVVPRSGAQSRWRGWLLAVIGLFAAIAVAGGSRILVVLSRWRALRKRLTSGDPRETAVGAWIWTRASLRMTGADIPYGQSVENIDIAAAIPNLPALIAPLQTMLAITEAALFAPGFDASTTTVNWSLADQICRASRRQLTRLRRLRLSVQAPRISRLDSLGRS
jgi:hypothetical protein